MTATRVVPELSPTRRTLWIAAVIAFSFLVGAGSQLVRMRSLDENLRETRRALLFTTLEARLGAATLEARRGSYAVARQLASEFYTGLQLNIADTPDAARRYFTGVLDRRDDVISELSREEETAAVLLSDLYLRWRSGMAELMREEGWSDPLNPTSGG